MAAGAVLIGAIGAVIVGLLIFGPRLLAVIGATVNPDLIVLYLIY